MGAGNKEKYLKSEGNRTNKEIYQRRHNISIHDFIQDIEIVPNVPLDIGGGPENKNKTTQKSIELTIMINILISSKQTNFELS